jgi:hypothetical protein
LPPGHFQYENALADNRARGFQAQCSAAFEMGKFQKQNAIE